MPDDSNISAINLKEILCRICKRARWLGQLELRRACLLAAQTSNKAGISDADRETLRVIGDGREALDRLHKDARLTAITWRFRNDAADQIHREECVRLKCSSHRQTAVQVARDTFLSAVAQVVSGFTKPTSEEYSDSLFARFCCWLLDDTGSAPWELERAAEILDTPDFREELLSKLWKECPEEAEELQLPPTGAGRGRAGTSRACGAGEKHTEQSGPAAASGMVRTGVRPTIEIGAMSDPSGESTRDLNQILATVYGYHLESLQQTVRLAASLALQEHSKLRQRQQRSLQHIRDGETDPVAAMQDESLTAILEPFIAQASETVNGEESRRLGRPLFAKTMWGVAASEVTESLQRIGSGDLLGFFPTVDLEEYCQRWLRGDVDAGEPLALAMQKLGDAGFADALLTTLRTQCPEEFEARRLPKPAFSRPMSESPMETCVVLGELGQPVSVLGKQKPPLTEPQYRVVKKLLAAGPDGLTKDALEADYDGGARRTLKRLVESDPDWARVIKFAGQRGKRYRIARPQD